MYFLNKDKYSERQECRILVDKEGDNFSLHVSNGEFRDDRSSVSVSLDMSIDDMEELIELLKEKVSK